VDIGEDDDVWPDEPEEFDPHSLGPETPGDEGSGVGVEPPSVDTDPGDVPADLARSFWGAVVLANVGLLGVSVAVMVVVFEGRWELGGWLAAVGVVAFAGTYRVYRSYTGGGED